MALAPLVAPACSGNPAASLCRDVCSCQGCSNSEEEQCIEAADEAKEDAEREGCTEEFDSYVGCLEDAFKCDDERAVFTENCSSEAEDWSESGAPVTGVGNVCDQAAAICNAQGGGEGELPECTGDVECISQCIVDAASCDFNDNPALNDCVGDCVGGI